MNTSILGGLIPLMCFVITIFAAVRGQASGKDSSTTTYGEFRLEAGASYGFGTTLYELNALAPDPRGGGSIVPIRSRLEFPLDVMIAGGNVTWAHRAGALERWAFSLRVLANLNDPSSKMTNSDFINGPEVIHAESDAMLNLIDASAEIRYRLTGTANTTFCLLFRTAYQRIEFQVIGYEGWQASLFTGQKFDISGTRPVLDYRVTYVSPQLGGEITHHLGGSVELGLKGSAGVVFASDFDNHILRRRTSEGTGTGIGLNTLVSLELLAGSLPVKTLSLALTGGVTYYRAKGGMDQTFADGSQYLDIPYLFESVQGSVGLAARYYF